MTLLPDQLVDLVSEGVEVFDLGRPLFAGMPQSPNHAPFQLSLQRRHGDVVRSDGGSAAGETIASGVHVGTHIDALAHVSADGKLHGGVDAMKAQSDKGFSTHGIETVKPFVCRGVLLDIPSVLGVANCEAAYEVSAADLESAAAKQNTALNPGDVVLIRTGWGRLFDAGSAYVGRESGTPGPGEQGASWLAEAGVSAAGSDTIAFERIAPAKGHNVLPVHRILLVEHGIHIIESLDLEALAASGTREFVFILSPLKIVGGTGSWVRPLAVVSKP